MGAKRELEVGVNEHINKVLVAALEAGEDDSGLSSERRQSALLVAGLLTAAKVVVMQAGAIVAEMELDGICPPGASGLPVFTLPGVNSARRDREERSPES